MVLKPNNEASSLLRQLAEDIYHEGEWIGKKAYRGYDVVDFQTIVIRSVIEILFTLTNEYRNDRLSIRRRDELVNKYIKANKLSLESRRVRALIERIHLSCEENPDYSKLRHDFRVQVQGLLNDKNRNLECEYQTIESVIKDKIAARPYRFKRHLAIEDLWNPPLEPYPVKEIVTLRESKTLEEPYLRIAIDSINREIYKRIINNPRVLKNMSWQQVEDLVVGIFKDFGYEIEERKRTRDGGIDVFAIHHSRLMGSQLYLVQVKHWRDKVDVKPVRELAFLHAHYHASKSCLATTSHFTQDAIEIFNQYRWVLEPRDFDGVLDWVRQAWEIVRQKDRESGL